MTITTSPERRCPHCRHREFDMTQQRILRCKRCETRLNWDMTPASPGNNGRLGYATPKQR